MTPRPSTRYLTRSLRLTSKAHALLRRTAPVWRAVYLDLARQVAKHVPLTIERTP